MIVNHHIQRFAVCAAIALSLATSALAQTAWPTRPIKIVVPYPAGGVVDVLGREVARHLQDRLGKPVLVENITGAGGTIGSTTVAKAPADGYTLLLGATGPISVGKVLYPDLPYDPKKDFKPIALLGLAPFILVTHKESRFGTVSALIAESKKNRLPVNYGSAGNGTPQHIIGEMFNSATGARLTHVPYRGSMPAIQDLMGKQIDLMFDNPVNLVEHIKSGRLLPLAQTGSKRLSVLPNVPTLREAGVSGFEATPWYGLLGPADMLPSVAQLLNDEINSYLRRPEVLAKWAQMGLESSPMPLAEFEAFLAGEGDKWTSAAKKSMAASK